MKHWYAVHTRPRQEDTAEEHLNRQSFGAYLPRVLLRKRKRDKWVKTVEPLFPRYLFIQVDSESLSLAPVRSTLGVAGPGWYALATSCVPCRMALLPA